MKFLHSFEPDTKEHLVITKLNDNEVDANGVKIDTLEFCSRLSHKGYDGIFTYNLLSTRRVNHKWIMGFNPKTTKYLISGKTSKAATKGFG